MLINILSTVHHIVTLLFGVFVSAAFLGIKLTRKNIFALLTFSLLVGGVYMAIWRGITEQTARQLYPLIIHLPLAIFLTAAFKRKILHSVLSVITAYLFCQISNWMGIAADFSTGNEIVYYAVRIVTTLLTFVVLMRYVPDGANWLLQKPTKDVFIFSLMPVVYYLFDYATVVYTQLLYTGDKLVSEFLGFAFCLSYMLFLFIYFKQFEKNCEAEQRNRLMTLQQQQAKKELEAIAQSKKEIAIIRHDMRHFLKNISAFIEKGEIEKAQDYIGELVTNADNTAVKRYCKNEIVNMIISANQAKFKDNGIDLRYNIQIPETLPCSDVDLTSILSNGLENAVEKVRSLPKEKRYIEIELYMNRDKLLISVKNPTDNPPVFKNGLPQASAEGHGFGTQSIQFVVEKLKGSCQFAFDNGMFVLRIII